MRLEREDRFQLEERYYKTIKMWLRPSHTLYQHQHHRHHRSHDDQWSTTAAPRPTSSVSLSPSPSPSSECCTFGMLRTALAARVGSRWYTVSGRPEKTEGDRKQLLLAFVCVYFFVCFVCLFVCFRK